MEGMTHEREESLGFFLPSFGPQCWEKMPDGLLQAVSYMFATTPHPLNLSRRGYLSMILGRAVSWSFMYSFHLEDELHSINDLWSITVTSEPAKLHMCLYFHSTRL